MFAALLAAAALFAWLSLRLRAVKSLLLRWLGIGAAGLLTLTLVLIGGAVAAGFYKQSSRSAPMPDLRVEGSDDKIQRGRAIADSFCGACHSMNGTFTRGEDIGKHLPVDLGTFVSSNLTAAGSLRHWSDGQLFRAIRNGVDAAGRRLVIMSLTNAGKAER
jgi:hypothetical protein